MSHSYAHTGKAILEYAGASTTTSSSSTSSSSTRFFMLLIVILVANHAAANTRSSQILSLNWEIPAGCTATQRKC
eukprot:1918241-Rhodomonas_salina.1